MTDIEKLRRDCRYESQRADEWVHRARKLELAAEAHHASLVATFGDEWATWTLGSDLPDQAFASEHDTLAELLRERSELQDDLEIVSAQCDALEGKCARLEQELALANEERRKLDEQLGKVPLG